MASAPTTNNQIIEAPIDDLASLIDRGRKLCLEILPKLSKEPRGFYAVIDTETGAYVIAPTSEEASSLYSQQFSSPGYGYRIGEPV